MRAPQIDLPLQPPAPAVQDAPARASRDDGNDFASTLKRSSAQTADNDQPHDQIAAKPEQPVTKEKTPAAPAEKPTTATAENAEKTAADSTAVAIPTVDAPADDLGLLDPTLAALLAVPVASAIVADDSASLIPQGTDPLAALVGPASTSALPVVNSPATDMTDLVASVGVGQAEKLPIVAIAAPTADTVPTMPVVSATPAALAALATPVAGEAVATADTIDVISTTPVIPVTMPAALAKTEVAPTVVTDTAAPATEVDASAALPPVTPGEIAAKPVLPKDANAIAPSDDAPAPATLLPLATPTTSATPAAQSTGMHAVAAAIGDQEAKDAKAQETLTAATKSVAGDLAAPVQATQPAGPTPITKPLSETVLAQNSLAQQGNAMEKAVSHQVAKALVQQLPNGDRMMVVRLTPPELGTVKVEVVERQGVLSARLHAEDDGVRLALERFLPAMRQELRASDAPIRQLDLSDQAQFQRSFADGQQGQQQQDANRPGNRRTRDDAPLFSLDGIRPEPVLVPRSAPLGGRVSLSGVDARA